MKRTVAFVLALAMIFALAACGKKPENKPEGSKETETREETKPENGETEAPEGDIDDPEYWSSIYDVSVCPFYVSKGGEEKTYYFRSGGSFIQWLDTELNTESWYYYNDRIITKDGKWAVEPDFDDSFSSCCSYEMKPYSGPCLSAEEQAAKEKGRLYALHSWTPLFFASWNGIFFEGDEKITDGDKEFGFSGLRADYGDQEWTSIYYLGRLYPEEEKSLLTEHCRLYVFPHKDIAEYKGFISEKDAEKALAVAAYQLRENPEALSEDEPIFRFYTANTYEGKTFAGDVDYIFTYDGIIAYYMIGTAHEAGWKP